jgi:dienelactone hydrolase
VLIAHDWTGRRAHACAGAERMAELGYVGFAVDIHGHDDPMVTPEQVLDFETEMSAANVDWQDHVNGGTSHAFTNPAANNRDLGTVYNQRASQARAGKALANFFHELFVEMPPLDVAP